LAIEVRIGPSRAPSRTAATLSPSRPELLPPERRLDQELAPVDLHHLPALGRQCSDAGGGEDAAESGTTGADALCKGPLWDQFHRKLPGKHQTLGLRIGTDM
jgi:hypothetical protein